MRDDACAAAPDAAATQQPAACRGDPPTAHVNACAAAPKAAASQQAAARGDDPPTARDDACAATAIATAAPEGAATQLPQAEAGALDLHARALSAVPHYVFTPALARSLTALDLSRNKITEVPEGIACLTALRTLDLSRNWLRCIPAAVGALSCLEELHLLSNGLHPIARSLPVGALAALPLLRLLDVRFNVKVKAPALLELSAALDARVTVMVTPGRGGDQEGGGGGSSGDGAQQGQQQERQEQEHACDRDPTQLLSQLEPYSTPQLRRRLGDQFGNETNPEDTGREEVLLLLLQEYEKRGPRAVRQVRGHPISAATYAAMLTELETMQWPAQRNLPRERPFVSATDYFTLNRPDTRFSNASGTKATRAAAKLGRYQRIWDLAIQAMREVDLEYAEQYSAIALTHNFSGSPHIDTENVGPFYGLSLGSYRKEAVVDAGCGKAQAGGYRKEAVVDAGSGDVQSPMEGAICVESGPFEVTECDTLGRLARVDGRFPHWVIPYFGNGDRYSVIYFRTEGPMTPITTATFY
ncbi:hypothetical protein FOA52_009686 [Chlamydomonas sp. UWO 241]|nr:hypothetical protein FOA52_009686 [Chlamydomonas sp. UWO 241]